MDDNMKVKYQEKVAASIDKRKVIGMLSRALVGRYNV